MKIKTNIHQPGQPLMPYWNVCVSGGRVAEALRADFQKHLEMVQREMPFRYLRAHGLFHEDMMVYREENGQPVVNWQYVDLVYDHWLSIGIRPFVELSFMPYDLASGSETVFWWKGNITPPRDWARWEWLIAQFIAHLIERYGVEEVRRWYFEVWNEPNLDAFWKNTDFDAYLELYERTCHVIKAIDPLLRVGGPASTGSGDQPGVAPWGEEFLAACAKRKLPLDFFSTHPYPTRHPKDAQGQSYMTWDGPDRLLVDASGYDRFLRQSAYPLAERHYTEWSSSPSPRDPVHDTAFLASFIVKNILSARGLMNSLSFWVVSDIFEEARLGDGPFHGGFGLVNIQGLKKPSYHGYWFLSRLGNEVLDESDSSIVTRRPDGALAILLWNYCHYKPDKNDNRIVGKTKSEEMYSIFDIQPAKEFELTIEGAGQNARIQTTRFDRDHGSVFDGWVAMGAPNHIRPTDLGVLHQKEALDVSVQRESNPAGVLHCKTSVEPFGVTLLEISAE